MLVILMKLEPTIIISNMANPISNHENPCSILNIPIHDKSASEWVQIEDKFQSYQPLLNRVKRYVKDSLLDNAPYSYLLGCVIQKRKGKKQFLEISIPFELVSRSNTLLALVVNKWLDTWHAIKNCKSLFQIYHFISVLHRYVIFEESIIRMQGFWF